MDRHRYPGSRLGPAAFTLIELLVVVAIVAMLIAMLTPALNTARATARQAVCHGNMRQIYIALVDYTGDHRGALPGPSTSGQLVGYSTTFTGLSRYLATYMGCEKVSGVMRVNPAFACPSFAGLAPPGVKMTEWIPYVAEGRDRNNQKLFGYSIAPYEAQSMRMTSVSDPAATHVLREIDELTHPNGWGGKVALAPLHGHTPAGLPVRTWSFFDGHAEARAGN
jgi:prepilin-type N-terminal cleavage/methylation domain-containing protein